MAQARKPRDSKHGSGPPRQPLGRILLKQRLVSPDELNDLLRSGRKLGARLASTAAARGTIADIQLLRALSEQHGVPGIDLSQIIIALSNLALVPKELAQQHKILPVVIQSDRIHLAMADPLDNKVVEEIEFITGRKVVRYVALHDALLNVMVHAYQMQQQGKPYYMGPFVPAAHLKNLEENARMPIEEAIVSSQRDTPMMPASRYVRLTGACFLSSLSEQSVSYSSLKPFRSIDAFMAYVSALEQGFAVVDITQRNADGLRICAMYKHYQDPNRIRLITLSREELGWQLPADLIRMGVSLSLVVEREDNLLQQLSEAIDPEPPDGLMKETIQAAIDESRRAFDNGHTQKAIGILTRAIDNSEPSFELHFNLGLLYGYGHQTYEAIRELELARAIVKTDYSLFKNLAILYAQEGFGHLAMDYWLAALDVAPDLESAQSVRKHIVNLLSSEPQP